MWFGLTQQQEARWGFDAGVKLGARLLLFQFKASNQDVSSKRKPSQKVRQFRVPHDQLVRLQALVKSPRSAFFVFPLVGTTAEVQAAKGDILRSTWVLDINTLGAIKPPTTSAGTLRKNGVHYADVEPQIVTIHSDPVEGELTNLADIAGAPELGVPMTTDVLAHWVEVEPEIRELLWRAPQVGMGEKLYRITRRTAGRRQPHARRLFRGHWAGALVLPPPKA